MSFMSCYKFFLLQVVLGLLQQIHPIGMRESCKIASALFRSIPSVVVFVVYIVSQ